MTKKTETVAEVIETEALVEVTKSEVAPEADAVVEEVTEVIAKAEETETADVVKSDEAVVEEIEKVADTDADVSKSDDVVAEAIAEAVTETNDGLEKAFSDLVEIVKSLQSEVELLKSTKVDIEVAQNSFEAVAKDLASATNVFNEFGKRVELVEQDTAFRKSGDLGEIVQDQPEMVEKSLWGGSFLKTTDLFK